MIRASRPFTVLAFTALFADTAFGATQAPVVIDSEQKAAAAVLAAHTFFVDGTGYNARQNFIDLTRQPRDVWLDALGNLASRVTPAALRISGGMEVPCAHGGTMHAELARGLLRTLKLRWNACVADVFGAPNIYQGSGELLLLSDSFTPTAVAALRLGTATEDFTSTFTFSDEFAEFSDTRIINLRMVGLVPMKRRSAENSFEGPFAYETTGFREFRFHYAFKQLPGIPPIDTTNRLSAEGLVTSGFLNLVQDSPTELLNDETWFHSGRLTTFGPGVNSSSIPKTETVDFDGLRIRTRDTDAGRSIAVDGRARLGWDPVRGAGCLNGLLTFRTATPLLQATEGSIQYKEGEIILNGSTTVKYFPPIVPDPSIPYISQGPIEVSVRNLGTFDYVFDGSVQSLSPTAQCSL